MIRVIIESPFAGDVDTHLRYARRCLADSLHRGEAPLASHLLYTQPGVLDDDDHAERQHGIDAGLAWGAVAHMTVVYVDHGISRGMEYGIRDAARRRRAVVVRALDLRGDDLRDLASCVQRIVDSASRETPPRPEATP